MHENKYLLTLSLDSAGEHSLSSHGAGHCAPDLQFDWTGFNQASKYVHS